MAKEYVEVPVAFLHETDGAVLVRDADDEEVWIPKSQFEDEEFDGKGIERGTEITISITEWIATEKELI